jgi:hypothetical protein
LVAAVPAEKIELTKADGTSLSPEMSARIADLNKALVLLGRSDQPNPTVSDEELLMLKRQGKL